MHLLNIDELGLGFTQLLINFSKLYKFSVYCGEGSLDVHWPCH